MAYSLISGFFQWLTYKEPLNILLIGLDNVSGLFVLLRVWHGVAVSVPAHCEDFRHLSAGRQVVHTGGAGARPDGSVRVSQRLALSSPNRGPQPGLPDGQIPAPLHLGPGRGLRAPQHLGRVLCGNARYCLCGGCGTPGTVCRGPRRAGTGPRCDMLCGRGDIGR